MNMLTACLNEPGLAITQPSEISLAHKMMIKTLKMKKQRLYEPRPTTTRLDLNYALVISHLAATKSSHINTPVPGHIHTFLIHTRQPRLVLRIQILTHACFEVTWCRSQTYPASPGRFFSCKHGIIKHPTLPNFNNRISLFY